MFLTKLIEKGKTISKANAAKLRKAWQEMADLLALAGEDPTQAAAEAQEAERSQNERAQLLRDAVQDSIAPNPDGYGPWVYIADVFDKTLVYCVDGTDCYQCDYSIAKDGTVALGAPAKVIPHMTYDPAPAEGADATEKFSIVGDTVPMMESGSGLLTEAGLAEAATAQIKVIDAGWGSTGYYSKELLQRDGPKAFPKGTHMYINHATAAERASRPEGDIGRLGAVLETDAVWLENGVAGPALYASAKVGENFSPILKDFRGDIGVSIYASGERMVGEAGGKKGYVITKLDSREAHPFNSVDFVTIAGRGGEVVNLFEAAGRRPAQPNQESEMTKEEIQVLVEAAVKPLRDENAASKTEAARLRESIALRDARDFTVRKLALVNMPEPTRLRLTESLPLKATLKDGALDEVAFTAVIEADAKAEMDYLSKTGAISGGKILGMGSTGSGAVVEVKQEDLVKSFMAMGMTEAAAKVAAAGREAA